MLRARTGIGIRVWARVRIRDGVGIRMRVGTGGNVGVQQEGALRNSYMYTSLPWAASALR